MDFDLTKEQEMIRKEVRKFAQKEIAPVAGELDEKEEFSEKLTRKMGEIGLFGMFVSEEYEGQEMDYISYIIGVEEIARVDGSQAATIAAGNSLGIGPIYYFGTQEQKKKYLPRLCAGGDLVSQNPQPAPMPEEVRQQPYLMGMSGSLTVQRYLLPMLPAI